MLSDVRISTFQLIFDLSILSSLTRFSQDLEWNSAIYKIFLMY